MTNSVSPRSAISVLSYATTHHTDDIAIQDQVATTIQDQILPFVNEAKEYAFDLAGDLSVHELGPVYVTSAELLQAYLYKQLLTRLASEKQDIDLHQLFASYWEELDLYPCTIDMQQQKKQWDFFRDFTLHLRAKEPLIQDHLVQQLPNLFPILRALYYSYLFKEAKENGDQKRVSVFLFLTSYEIQEAYMTASLKDQKARTCAAWNELSILISGDFLKSLYELHETPIFDDLYHDPFIQSQIKTGTYREPQLKILLQQWLTRCEYHQTTKIPDQTKSYQILYRMFELLYFQLDILPSYKNHGSQFNYTKKNETILTTYLTSDVDQTTSIPHLQEFHFFWGAQLAVSLLFESNAREWLHQHHNLFFNFAIGGQYSIQALLRIVYTSAEISSRSLQDRQAILIRNLPFQKSCGKSHPFWELLTTLDKDLIILRVQQYVATRDFQKKSFLDPTWYKPIIHLFSVFEHDQKLNHLGQYFHEVIFNKIFLETKTLPPSDDDVYLLTRYQELTRLHLTAPKQFDHLIKKLIISRVKLYQINTNQAPPISLWHRLSSLIFQCKLPLSQQTMEQTMWDGKHSCLHTAFSSFETFSDESESPIQKWWSLCHGMSQLLESSFIWHTLTLLKPYENAPILIKMKQWLDYTTTVAKEYDQYTKKGKQALVIHQVLKNVFLFLLDPTVACVDNYEAYQKNWSILPSSVRALLLHLYANSNRTTMSKVSSEYHLLCYYEFQKPVTKSTIFYSSFLKNVPLYFLKNTIEHFKKNPPSLESSSITQKMIKDQLYSRNEIESFFQHVNKGLETLRQEDRTVTQVSDPKNVTLECTYRLVSIARHISVFCQAPLFKIDVFSDKFFQEVNCLLQSQTSKVLSEFKSSAQKLSEMSYIQVISRFLSQIISFDGSHLLAEKAFDYIMPTELLVSPKLKIGTIVQLAKTAQKNDLDPSWSTKYNEICSPALVKILLQHQLPEFSEFYTSMQQSFCYHIPTLFQQQQNKPPKEIVQEMFNFLNYCQDLIVNSPVFKKLSTSHQDHYRYSMRELFVSTCLITAARYSLDVFEEFTKFAQIEWLGLCNTSIRIPSLYSLLQKIADASIMQDKKEVFYKINKATRNAATVLGDFQIEDIKKSLRLLLYWSQNAHQIHVTQAEIEKLQKQYAKALAYSSVHSFPQAPNQRINFFDILKQSHQLTVSQEKSEKANEQHTSKRHSNDVLQEQIHMLTITMRDKERKINSLTKKLEKKSNSRKENRRTV